MAGVSERHRQWVALALIGLGVGLILLGFVVFLEHRNAGPVGPISPHPAAVTARAKASVIQQVLFLAVVLALIFVVSTLAFLRWSRHFRRWILRKPRPPTPSEDVWAMHKLPEGAVEQWDDSGLPDDPGPESG